jgi:hypothetical protein
VFPDRRGAPPHLIVFTRYPEPGAAKTRLIPALGAEGAAGLQRTMTAHALLEARRARIRLGFRISVAHAGGDAAQMAAWLGPDIDYIPQEGADLGARLDHAFRRVLAKQPPWAAVMGCDCPGLTHQHISQVLSAAKAADMALAPAEDGGYVLVALRRCAPSVFEGIDWGGAEVLEQQVERAEALGLRVYVHGEKLPDVDEPVDLRHWPAPCPDAPRISVVIPALNEGGNILDCLAAADLGTDAPVEHIVADGGSADGTRALARAHGARVVASPAGRSRQMNAAAAKAHAPVLLFVHADTLLPEHWLEEAERLLARPDAAAGAFRLRIDGGGFIYRMIEAVANGRSRLLQMPYGDQGLLVRKSIFEDAGTFPALPIMEDFEFVRRLRRKGRIALSPLAARTSSRRWRETGPLRLTWRHALIIWRYLRGASPEELIRLRKQSDLSGKERRK